MARSSAIEASPKIGNLRIFIAGGIYVAGDEARLCLMTLTARNSSDKAVRFADPDMSSRA
jgi:hypothetical protein